jgi:hypothetical protein
MTHLPFLAGAYALALLLPAALAFSARRRLARARRRLAAVDPRPGRGGGR